MKLQTFLLVAAGVISTAGGFVVVLPSTTTNAMGVVVSTSTTVLRDQIVSPFDSESDGGDSVATYNPYKPTDVPIDEDGPLDLTWENVDKVLEEMRPYLIQDGGNVAISEIDGPVVRLELQVRSVLSCQKVIGGRNTSVSAV
jgi:NifU-like domain